MSSSNSRLRVSVSRPRTSRNQSVASASYVTQAESLILPSGPVSENTAVLLHEFVHPHHHIEEQTLGSADSSEDAHDAELIAQEERERRAKLPWWKRPTPWWLLIALPFTAIAMSSTLAPRIEIYTLLACNVHKPEYTAHMDLRYLGIRYDVPEDPAFSGILPVEFGTNNSQAFSLNKVVLSVPYSLSNNATNLCASDPVVQAAVAKLSTAMTASMGILGCLTAAWWGSYSDRFGRTSVMGISLIGLLFTDFNFIFVSKFSQKLPGNYWFLLAGPLLEGSLGGMSSAIAASHAYMADCIDPATRSRVFSLSLGLLFTGMAVGPTLGSICIRITQSTLSVFYAATILHLAYSLLIWFVIPESLSARQMSASRQKYVEDIQEDQSAAVGALIRVRRLFSFLSPLTIFLPVSLDQESSPFKTRKRDWNLTLIVAAYGSAVTIMGSYSFKFQYAASTFGWTSETMGYWLSIVGASRALFLSLILPAIIHFLKATPKPVKLSDETSPLIEPSSSSSSTSLDTPAKAQTQKVVHSPFFDLNLARISLLIEVIAYTLMGLASSAGAFTMFTIAGSLGSGFSPAIQSVALELYSRRGGRESGRLFGALSVVQALCSQVLGPAIYGFTYVKTVATFPRTIFFLSVTAVAVSLILLKFVRLQTTPTISSDVEGQETPDIPVITREETLIDIDEEVERGRKRKLSTSEV